MKLNSYFSDYTYGKVYEVLSNSNPLITSNGSPIVDIIDDNGYRHFPLVSGTNSDGDYTVYFITLEEWRDNQLDYLLLPDDIILGD